MKNESYRLMYSEIYGEENADYHTIDRELIDAIEERLNETPVQDVVRLIFFSYMLRPDYFPEQSFYQYAESTFMLKEDAQKEADFMDRYIF